MSNKKKPQSTPKDRTKYPEIFGFNENSFPCKENHRILRHNRNLSGSFVSLREENLFNSDILKDLNSSLQSRGIQSLLNKNNGKSFLSIISNDNSECINLQKKKKIEVNYPFIKGREI